MKKKLITESEIREIIKGGSNEVLVPHKTIFTPLALDLMKHSGIKIIFNDATPRTTVSDEIVFKTIAIASDHTGFHLKGKIVKELSDSGYHIIDVGTNSDKSCDYPDFAIAAALKVASGECDGAVILDATGIPSSLTANKVPGIRAATCYNEFSARSSREHNNSNIICLGAQSLGATLISEIIKIWLNSVFLGGRHQRRLDKITEIEKKFVKG